MSVRAALTAMPEVNAAKSPATGEGAVYPGFDVAKLVDHFDVIATAVGGLTRLRQMILDLARRGLLVSQDANEGSGVELASLFTSAPAYHSEGDRLPASWGMVRIGDVAGVQAGFAFASDRFNEKGIGLPLIRIRDISATETTVFCDGPYREEFVVRPGDHLIGMDGDFNMREWRGPSALLNQRVCRILYKRAEINPRYVLALLQRELDRIHDATSFTTVKHLSNKQVAEILLPLPPFPEQKRIVAKVDQLMALCDELEARQNERREIGARLSKSALEALTTAEAPEEFDAAWKRVVENFDVLIDRAESISELRPTILQLAVTGRLVEQRLDDEPAEKLVAALHAERAAKKPTPQVHESALPRAPLPPGWSWALASDAACATSVITYGILKPAWVTSGVPTVRVKDLKNGVIVLQDVAQCSKDRASKFSKTTLKAGDLLIAKDGATLGKTAFVPASLEGGNITQHVLRFPISRLLCREYVRLIVDAPHGQRWMKGETRGVALPGVNVEDFRRMPLPLPPLAEQRRIVVKVERLMKACDILEASLRRAEKCAGRLVEAVVSELVL